MILPLLASAQDISFENYNGVTIYYNFINNGTELQVTNRGGSFDSSYKGKVVIPGKINYGRKSYKVTSIGDNAFWSCPITSVTIPNNVTSIGVGAFRNCFVLTSVTIPKSVTSIGEGAFEDCACLTSVVIPESVRSVGKHAFRRCYNLTSVTITNSLTSIGDDAFPPDAKIIREDANEMSNAPLLTNKQPVNSNQIPNLVVLPNSITFTDASGANAIVGGKNSTITLEVKNTGKGDAYNCLAKINSKGANLGIETNNVTLGIIAAGETM